MIELHSVERFAYGILELIFGALFGPLDSIFCLHFVSFAEAFTKHPLAFINKSWAN